MLHCSKWRFIRISFQVYSRTERPRFDRILLSEVNKRYENAFSLYLQFIGSGCSLFFFFFKCSYNTIVTMFTLIVLTFFSHSTSEYTSIQSTYRVWRLVVHLNASSLSKACTHPKLNFDTQEKGWRLIRSNVDFRKRLSWVTLQNLKKKQAWVFDSF